MNLIKSAHTEPAIQALVTDENILLADEDAWRTLAGSQELRDYIAPYLSALIKKALSPDGVEAFDDAFRNTYFAVVNRVINYYQTYRPAADASNEVRGTSPKSTNSPSASTGGKDNLQLTTNSSQKRSNKSPNAQTVQTQPESDTSATAVPLPPFDEPEPTAVTPLLSSDDVEAITHEDLEGLEASSSSRKSPKKVTGTGLE